MGDLPESERAGQYLVQQGEELYGLPEPAIFNNMINNLRDKVVNYQGTDDTALTIKQELLGLLPEDLPSTDNTQTIDYAELINYYRPLIEVYFAGLLAVVPDDKDDLSPKIWCRSLLQVLDTMNRLDLLSPVNGIRKLILIRNQSLLTKKDVGLKLGQSANR